VFLQVPTILHQNLGWDHYLLQLPPGEGLLLRWEWEEDYDTTARTATCCVPFYRPAWVPHRRHLLLRVTTACRGWDTVSDQVIPRLHIPLPPFVTADGRHHLSAPGYACYLRNTRRLEGLRVRCHRRYHTCDLQAVTTVPGPPAALLPANTTCSTCARLRVPVLGGCRLLGACLPAGWLPAAGTAPAVIPAPVQGRTYLRNRCHLHHSFHSVPLLPFSPPAMIWEYLPLDSAIVLGGGFACGADTCGGTPLPPGGCVSPPFHHRYGSIPH